jgi:hypothetical protein
MQPRNLRGRLFLFLGGALLLAAATPALVQQPAPPAAQGQPRAGEYRLSGPYRHDNLTVFLIHGKDRLTLTNYLTLPEALAQKKAVVRETQSVNQLFVENLSPSEQLVVLSGDIVKGGQQDRFARFDLVVPPKSGKVALAVYCVERTAPRWMRRLEGADKKFAASPGLVNSNYLRLNARFYTDQGKVWKGVAKIQGKLSMNAGAPVQAKESESSLALSLEAKKVRAAVDGYVRKLRPVVEGKKDVIGYAFAINGKVYSADVYGSSALFRKVWPRLLKATAQEAFADLDKGKKFAPVSAATVTAFLKDADRGKVARKEGAAGTRQVIRESPRNVLFDCRDEKRGEVLRRNYLAK